jgi:hypothetical protein
MKSKEVFPSAQEDVQAAELCVQSPQTLSPSYRLAYRDSDFLLKDELRPVRLQLELLKPELLLQEHHVESTIIGGARIPEPAIAIKEAKEAETASPKDPANTTLARTAKIAKRIADKAKYYEEARRFAYLISQAAVSSKQNSSIIVTGGGQGIMEAANRGAYEAGAQSVGLNIVLPFEQRPNGYITPELCFQFHYFAIRKMHFLMRARALVVFPGGYGTLDELFDTLTLIQTTKIKPIPVLIFGRKFWRRIIKFDALVEEGTISPQDIKLFRYVETAEEAADIILGTHP